MSSLIDPPSARLPRHKSLLKPEGPADWIPATDRPLVLGESVHCAEGLASLSRILGKTSDGSRLLELLMPDRPKHHPFFAAASNVRIAPTAA